jgi:hypothetical protein
VQIKKISKKTGATEGPYEYEALKFGDHVMLRHPKEFYEYCENKKSRKDCEYGPFTIKKIRKKKKKKRL